MPESISISGEYPTIQWFSRAIETHMAALEIPDDSVSDWLASVSNGEWESIEDVPPGSREIVAKAAAEQAMLHARRQSIDEWFGSDESEEVARLRAACKESGVALYDLVRATDHHRWWHVRPPSRSRVLGVIAHLCSIFPDLES